MDKDESKIGDAIDIVNEYHKYVPLKPDGSPLTLPLHADGLSCERVNDAQNARINGTTKWLQLQGLSPTFRNGIKDAYSFRLVCRLFFLIFSFPLNKLLIK